MTIAEIERRERDIAARENIPYDRCDRVWLRRRAIQSLRRDEQCNADSFDAIDWARVYERSLAR